MFLVNGGVHRPTELKYDDFFFFLSLLKLHYGFCFSFCLHLQSLISHAYCVILQNGEHSHFQEIKKCIYKTFIVLLVFFPFDALLIFSY